MVDSIRFSPQLLSVLAALLEQPAEWRYGYDLSRETDLKSGTLYPLLIRLAERQWVESRWRHAEENGKPRHIYRLTAAGRRAARDLLHEQAKRRVLKPVLQER
jgi:DNA-binding PadR family transcriptional regulator